MIRKLINNFLEKAKAEENMLEAVCLCDKNGVVFKEQYIARLTRNIYSHSKSFTALMVGIAIDEGKLTLDTRLADVFKDEIDEETYQKLYDIQLKHLLAMRSGLGGPWLMQSQREEGQGYPDYLKFLFSKELVAKPGEQFVYSNGDTYLCSRMVSKVYDRNYRDLCYEKIFLPMEMGFVEWGVDPLGYCIGASAMHLNVENMNKLGLLYINDGVYKGKRIVSKEWIDTIYASNNPESNYAFQHWTFGPDVKCLFASGMYGQNTYIFREHGVAFSYQRPEDTRGDRLNQMFKEEVVDKL
jgi:CubicO group peptidase (beta-lactamase class C family)